MADLYRNRNIGPETPVSRYFALRPLARQLPAHKAYRHARERIHVSVEDARLRYHRAAERVQSEAVGHADAHLSARARRKALAADQRAQGAIRTYRA